MKNGGQQKYLDKALACLLYSAVVYYFCISNIQQRIKTVKFGGINNIFSSYVFEQSIM